MIVSIFLWYFGLGFILMGIGMTIKDKQMWFWICCLPIIIWIEPAFANYFNIDFIPRTLHHSIMINSYEMFMAMLGFLIVQKARGKLHGQ